MCTSHSLTHTKSLHYKAHTIKLTPYSSHTAVAKHSINQLTSHLFIPLSPSPYPTPPTIISPRETSQAPSSPLPHNKSRTEPTRDTATDPVSTRARGNKRALRINRGNAWVTLPEMLTGARGRSNKKDKGEEEASRTKKIRAKERKSKSRNARP